MDKKQHNAQAHRAIEAHAAEFGLTCQTIGQYAAKNRLAYDRASRGKLSKDICSRVLDWIAQDRIKRRNEQAFNAADELAKLVRELIESESEHQTTWDLDAMNALGKYEKARNDSGE